MGMLTIIIIEQRRILKLDAQCKFSEFQIKSIQKTFFFYSLFCFSSVGSQARCLMQISFPKLCELTGTTIYIACCSSHTRNSRYLSIAKIYIYRKHIYCKLTGTIKYIAQCSSHTRNSRYLSIAKIYIYSKHIYCKLTGTIKYIA